MHKVNVLLEEENYELVLKNIYKILFIFMAFVDFKNFLAIQFVAVSIKM